MWHSPSRARAVAALVFGVALCPEMVSAVGDVAAPAATPTLADAGAWRARPAAGVALALAEDSGPAPGEPAMRLDFDFQGRAGWAAAARDLVRELPENWELRFWLRGEAPDNHLEVKFVDPSGENVWWSVRRDLHFPQAWTPFRIRRRDVTFAWGPQAAPALTAMSALELAITAGGGGRGSVWISRLELVERPPELPYAGRPTAHAATRDGDTSAGATVDGNAGTAWQAAAGASSLLIDYGSDRDFGGLTIRFPTDATPDEVDVELAEAPPAGGSARFVDAGHAMRPARGGSSGATRADFRLPDARARWVRLSFRADHPFAVTEVETRPLAFGASWNAFFETVAKESARGVYPRGFSGEQVYWTVAGVDGAPGEILISEDGAIELGERGPSIEPFVIEGAALRGWADARSTASLVDGDLPIPRVALDFSGLRIDVTAFATALDATTATAAVAIYRLSNTTTNPRRGTLVLALRPFQVNPPTQFLNVAGGVSEISRVRCTAGGLAATSPGGEREIHVAPPPEACSTTDLAGGPFASGELRWTFDLAPGASREFTLVAPIEPGAADGVRRLAARLRTPGDAAGLLETERRAWRERLDRVRVDVPKRVDPESKLARTVRSSLGWILVHRDGPAIQPGSRAYARSWIRDGALTGTALIRLGHQREAQEFVEWFAGFQAADGRVPCCVDRRGADPVPEHDSHGEFLHLAREVQRAGGDAAFTARLLPHVERAVAAIDALRAERRTSAYAAGEARRFFGLLPESISHEGYSSKARHSYWDDGFAYRGLDDAAAFALAAGRKDLAAKFAASRDEFRHDVLESLERVRAAHGIPYLPGCAELGDFDATSTTTLLDPDGLLPPEDTAVRATFERYWAEFSTRRAGGDGRSWDAYTPYELRNVGAFVRLGWRDRAQELLSWFFEHQRPAGWNAWAEVVGSEERTPRFLGDLPHGWVASDFARSALDLFAYERLEDRALVLFAGVPESWLRSGEATGVSGLVTPWGTLSARLEPRHGGRLAGRIDLAGGEGASPPGGVVLDLPALFLGSSTRVNGSPARRDARGRIVVDHLPVDIDIAAPGPDAGSSRRD
jgi:hypothetical protein